MLEGVFFASEGDQTEKEEQRREKICSGFVKGLRRDFQGLLGSV